MVRTQRRWRHAHRLLDALIALGCVAAILIAWAVIYELGRASAAVERSRAATAAIEAAHRQTVARMESFPVRPNLPARAQMVEAPVVLELAEAPDFYREEIPLSRELQYALHSACEEFNVPFALALGVMEQESRFQMLTGDGGASVGYFQVQERWWSWLMEEIGTSDLSDPAQNVRTGCAVLGHLLGEYGAQRDALTAYNTGSPGTSSYAEETLARADAWEEILRQGKEYSDGTHADAGNAAGH